MKKKIFIVTDVEAGWDCVVGAYEEIPNLRKAFGLAPLDNVPHEYALIIQTKEDLRELKNRSLIIHTVELN